jgi:hypothetical protein
MRLSAATTHKAKTRQVARSRGQQCGDIELPGYLANEAGPVPLVLDLHIAHERWGSSSDPTLNGNLHYPNDIDRSLNETAADKIRKYRADYNNNPPNAIAFMPAILVRLGGYIVKCAPFIFTNSSGNCSLLSSFKSSAACATYLWTLPLPPRGVSPRSFERK